MKGNSELEELLNNALESAENDDTRYWICTALQHAVAEIDDPD